MVCFMYQKAFVQSSNLERQGSRDEAQQAQQKTYMAPVHVVETVAGGQSSFKSGKSGGCFSSRAHHSKQQRSRSRSIRDVTPHVQLVAVYLAFVACNAAACLHPRHRASGSHLYVLRYVYSNRGMFLLLSEIWSHHQSLMIRFASQALSGFWQQRCCCERPARYQTAVIKRRTALRQCPDAQFASV
jgi:hypothetical protein